MLELTLITKNKCGLCEVMKEEIKSALNNVEYSLQEKLIENEDSLFNKYSGKVPVLLINGKIFAKFRLDGNKLLEKIGTLT